MTSRDTPGSSAPLWKFFEEDRYLAANPDVAKAVRDGHIHSGQTHYQLYGFAENRSLGWPSRREQLLHGCNPAVQRGLEIGALMTPIVSKAEGEILYVDHADTDTLRAKYTGDPNVHVDAIVPVDVVWRSGSLRDALDPAFLADYIIASHVIEHVPDLITWLNHLCDVLAPEGQLRLAIPDRRYTFDILRVETRLHDVLDAYLVAAQVPTPHVVLDHCVHFRKVDPIDAWSGKLDMERLEPLFDLNDVLAIARRALNKGEYLDVHCWVFTPLSFASLMEQLNAMELVQLACADFWFPQPFGNEFIVGLRKSGGKTEGVQSWQRMASSAKTAGQ